ncbi:c2 and gram domain-containing protein at1g03370 [Phtheirospermum japonicum]|uniref:C2 and gram domain-containing protein at1g03370 n=1 Tax=Phtheirospermum japonicum TaxID=374723 RepID=A0A830D9F6_9LAMI|nr:c2 and gram domain-containing protein at1g03370 [Phtheirospermum japonicum]
MACIMFDTYFSCSLKRKMPLQGRLFLSDRIVGFYVNLLGHKTRFFFLWEDIEEIQVLPLSLSTVGSSSIEITMHKGRGFDARHGAKILDEHGRLHFHFHSFVSFNDASRMIMALWRARTLGPDQKAEIADKQVVDDEKPVLIEDTGFYLVVEDAKMTKVYTVELPLNISRHDALSIAPYIPLVGSLEGSIPLVGSLEGSIPLVGSLEGFKQELICR